MAVEIGVSSGFVTTAPSADPSGTAYTLAALTLAARHTAPAGAIKIVEIGWWVDSSTADVNFEVGIYSHNGGTDKPDSLLGVSRTNSVGTAPGWKSAVVDIDISESTIYWIALQYDTGSTIYYDYGSLAGEKALYKTSTTTLDATWSAGTTVNGSIYALYAVYSTGATNIPVFMNQYRQRKR